MKFENVLITQLQNEVCTLAVQELKFLTISHSYSVLVRHMHILRVENPTNDTTNQALTKIMIDTQLMEPVVDGRERPLPPPHILMYWAKKWVCQRVWSPKVLFTHHSTYGSAPFAAVYFFLQFSLPP